MIQQLGKFKLLKKIASGGMAEIYIAQQRGLEGFEKIVCIKTILPHLANNNEFVQMFLDEARLAARLTHPNIVQIFDLGRVGQSYFIAMEFIHGENLRQIARTCRKQGKPIPTEHMVKIISQTCEGLYYAHTKTDPSGKPLNIVHRDVSPQNILVSFEGVTKIVDFGIAKAATQYQETRAGVLKGKYSYMSPEQCSGHAIDARSDIFSLGILTWELATGARLYKRDSELQILKDITESPVPPPRQINPQVPAELEAVILKALEKDPNKRFQNALEMHLALEQFAKNRNLTSSTVHLAGFMRTLFPEKLESLRKIEQAQSSGERLESFLFDDMEQSNMYYPGGTTPSRGIAAMPSPMAEPGSQPLIPKPTTGVSRVQAAEQKPPPRKTALLGILIVSCVIMLGVIGWLLWKHFSQDTEDLPRDTPVATGAVTVDSDPQGAAVLLDGKRVGTTPCQVTSLALKRDYQLEVAKEGFQKWNTRFLLENTEVRNFVARLERQADIQPASVEIVSVPPGASVALNGKPQPGTTPLKISGLEPGRSYEIMVSMEGRKNWSRTLELAAGENQSLAVRLEPVLEQPSTPGKKKAQLTLQSAPEGAAFTVNGNPAPSPLELNPGKYLIAATLDGHRPWTQNVVLKAGEKKTLVARLVPQQAAVANSQPGLLSVDCKPWARVFVDNRQIGVTPIVDFALAPGKYTVRLENEELSSIKQFTVNLKSGERVIKSMAFGQGYLKIIVKPWAHVYINGKKIGTTPFPPKPLFEGSYQVEVKNPDLGRSEERTIKIEEGKTAEIVLDFLQ